MPCQFQVCGYFCKRETRAETVADTELRQFLEQFRAEKPPLRHEQSTTNRLLRFIREKSRKSNELNPVQLLLFRNVLPASLHYAYGTPAVSPAQISTAARTSNIQQKRKRSPPEAGSQKDSSLSIEEAFGGRQTRITIDLTKANEEEIPRHREIPSVHIMRGPGGIPRPGQIRTDSFKGARQSRLHPNVGDCQRSTKKRLTGSDFEFGLMGNTQEERSNDVPHGSQQSHAVVEKVSRSNDVVDENESMLQTNNNDPGSFIGQHHGTEFGKSLESGDILHAEQSWNTLIKVIHANITAEQHRNVVLRAAQRYGAFQIAEKKKMVAARTAVDVEYARLKTLAESDSSQWTEFVCQTRMKDEEDKWQARNRRDWDHFKRLIEHSGDTIRKVEKDCADKDKEICQIKADSEKQAMELELRFAGAIKQQSLAIARAEKAEEACAVAGELKDKWKKKTLDSEADLVKVEGKLLQEIAQKEKFTAEMNEISRIKAVVEGKAVGLEAKLAHLEVQLSQEAINQEKATRDKNEINKAKVTMKEAVAGLEAKLVQVEEQLSEEVTKREEAVKKNNNISRAKADVEGAVAELAAKLARAEDQVSQLADKREEDAQTFKSTISELEAEKKRLEGDLDDGRAQREELRTQRRKPEALPDRPETRQRRPETRQRGPETRQRGLETRSQRSDKLGELSRKGSRMLK